MTDCRQCGGPLQTAFRFCPWCAAPQRLKLVEFFRPHRGIAQDRRRALRVSRYLGPRPEERHVRFSVWSDGEAEGAVSLDERETQRLAGFLSSVEPARRSLRAKLASHARSLS